jgi:hypothetical protein
VIAARVAREDFCNRSLATAVFGVSAEVKSKEGSLKPAHRIFTLAAAHAQTKQLSIHKNFYPTNNANLIAHRAYFMFYANDIPKCL